MKTIYRFQYNTGQLSLVIKDDKKTICYIADLLNKPTRYPVCIWTIKPKMETA